MLSFTLEESELGRVLWDISVLLHNASQKHAEGAERIQLIFTSKRLKIRMEEWRCKWFVSLSAEWNSGPDAFTLTMKCKTDVILTLKSGSNLIFNPIWYFGAGRILTIYSNPFDKVRRLHRKRILRSSTTKIKDLAPQYFRDEVHSYITPNDSRITE